MTDIVEIKVVEERDALECKQRFQAVLRACFQQTTQQIFRCIAQFALQQHSCDAIDFAIINCTARCIVNLIETFEFVFVLSIFVFLLINQDIVTLNLFQLTFPSH